MITSERNEVVELFVPNCVGVIVVVYVIGVVINTIYTIKEYKRM
jgi:hypothetical protein